LVTAHHRPIAGSRSRSRKPDSNWRHSSRRQSSSRTQGRCESSDDNSVAAQALCVVHGTVGPLDQCVD
jgi:hypothetical protein